jgi:hypothetical protein
MVTEFILFTYALGLLALGYGLYIAVVGRVYLTSWSRQPILGAKARVLGLARVLLALVYFAVVTWAWSKYDR